MMDDDIKIDPCPFCGTSPMDADHPAILTLTGPKLSIDCGFCGASWPPILRESAADPAGIETAWNRRAALQSEGK